MGMEDQLQAKCYQWLHNTYPELRGFFFAVPNGGYRDIREAAKLQATGVVPGIPDLILVWPVLVGFELKSAKGRRSPSQENIAQRWGSKSIPIHIIKEFSTFSRIIAEIYAKKP
jgi:hypothetical protein